jgi:DNA-binding IclR family transcriptional regulator
VPHQTSGAAGAKATRGGSVSYLRRNAPAAAHALQLLKLLARHAGPLPASAIARDLGLPRSSAYHLLSVLQEEGFVVHLPEQRRFGLGVGAYELGSAYLRQDPLRWIAQNVLTRLAAATTQNAHLAVLQGREVLYVIEERAPGRPGLVTEVGVRLPAHLTASGLAMLAALGPQQVNALFPSRRVLTRRHEAGPASLTQLRALLVAARAAGFASEDGFVTPGLKSIACAALDHTGHPIAAVAVTFATGEPDEELAPHVRRAAGEVSRRIRGSRT